VAYSAPDEERTTHFALSPNGAIGSWVLGGPCADIKSISAGVQPGYGRPCSAGRWHGVASASGDFDWAESLGVAANSQAAASAGLWLYLKRPFDGWLLVAADGWLQVAVDGRWVHRRQSPQQRGRAFVPIPLHLDPGAHPVLLALERVGNRSSFSVLLRDKETNQAPRDALVYLPAGPTERRLVEQLLTFSLRIPPEKDALSLELGLSFPSGFPSRPLPLEIELGGTAAVPAQVYKPGTLTAELLGQTPFIVRLGPIDGLPQSPASTLTIRMGDAPITRRLWLTREAVASLERANRARSLEIIKNSARDRYDALGATLDAHWDLVVERLLQPAREELDDSVRRLDALTSQLEDGKSPFATPGYVDAFLRSPYDGRPTSVLTYVPADFHSSDEKARPLVVLLHGYNGTPRRILDAFLDVGNSRLKANVDGLLVAPAAYGNSFYRGPGEQAVIDAINWATATYPIDRSRISITGVSMGGTGTAEIAFHQSQLFAAAAPLCGYQSYFVRRDTTNKPLRPWERRLMHRFSPASQAESGNDVPLFVAQGTQDLPLENSRVLTTRYRTLGYTLTEDWPNLGHAVWKKTYRNAALYPWLTKWHKDLDPAHVVLASSSLANGRKFWLELTELGESEEPALLDARVLSPTELEVNSRGVVGFHIGASRHIAEDKTLRVRVDGASLEVPSGQQRRFVKVNGDWQLSSGQPDPTTAGIRVEGPWSELFSAPLAVVWGSGNPTTAALNREIATRLVEARSGVDLHVLVTSDREFLPNRSPLMRVIYVGRPDDHVHLAAIAHRLPIRLTSSGVELGNLRFDEPDVGVAFVYPDPDRRDRLLGVVSGNGPEGMWRVLALPGLVPDFVLFDRGVDAAAGEPVLGRSAFLRAAGFFRSDWTLPEAFLDPLAPKAR
jgi:predicted esterase